MSSEFIYYCIYKTTNLITGMIYVGVHKTKNLNDSYLGTGGRRYKASIKKYGKNNFKKEIIMLCDSEKEMYEIEGLLICEVFISRPDVYNLNIGGRGGWNYINNRQLSQEEKQLRSKKCSLN